MLNPQAFHELVSGRRRDWRAVGSRSILQALEPAYATAVVVRNLAFDVGLRPIHRVNVPVISVGNITAGGTGKTPFVAWLVKWLLNQSQRVAIVSRGYHARPGSPNDEALELEQQLGSVPHLQNADRVAAARQAIDQHKCQAIVLDDGFQHRRLHRDLDIVLIDALNPFGFEHLLPRGLLRESLAGLSRAHVIAISRANLVDHAALDVIHSRITRCAPSAIQIQIEFIPQLLRSASGESQQLSDVRGKQVLAFCGIGNPEGFARSLASCGLEVAGQRIFPDHHLYSPDDVSSIESWASEFPQATAIICTEKDLVKLKVSKIGRLPLWSLRASAHVRRGLDEFERRLSDVIGQSSG